VEVFEAGILTVLRTTSLRGEAWLMPLDMSAIGQHTTDLVVDICELKPVPPMYFSTVPVCLCAKINIQIFFKSLI
jgi:hypothetical protein